MATSISRRNFLSTAGAAAVSPLLAQSPASKPAGMRVGVDTDKQPRAVQSKGAIAMLDYTKQNGFDGAAFRLVLDLSPTLDNVQLKEVKAHADSLGLFLEVGVGWMNPYNTPERPEVRRFGGGDYRLAMERMLKACRLIDCTELWAVSAHTVHGTPSFVAYDRLRTDVSWGDQLVAMTKFINSIAPMLRDLKLRLNMEAHGDETSYELLRLINEVGPDVVGVTLDSGNFALEGDVPMDALRRLAPYINYAQAKDGILYHGKDGLSLQTRTIGEGMFDWPVALDVLSKYHPNLHICIENYRAISPLPWADAKNRRHYPELTEADVKEFERLAAGCEERIRRGQSLGVEEYQKLPFGDDERLKSYQVGAAYLKKIIKEKRLGYV
jgi:sugar phosphate isomerase/epimerase